MESKKIKILAIDDNSDNLITIKALIYEAFENALIFTALSGIKGLELAATENPDVILLDIVMPDMDGFEVCQRLKADNKLSDIPVVFVTALKGDKESRIRGLEVGAEAFLAKPIDESELTAQIRAMVKIKASNIEKHNEKERLAALVAERTRELKENHVATLNLLDDLKNENEARRKSEEALHASEVKFRTVADFAYDWEYWQGADNQLIYISPSCERISGYKLDEFLSDNTLLKKIVHPDDSALMNDHFKRVHTSDHQFVVEEFDYKIIKKDGSVVHIGHLCRPVFDDQGNYCGRRVSNRDITERKQAQDALRESEEKYRLLFANNPQPMWIYDLETLAFMEVNNSAINHYGYSREEFLSMTIKDIRPAEDLPALLKNIEQVKLNKESIKQKDVEWIHLKKNGEQIIVELTTVSIISNGRKASHILINDITERKQAEDKLRESESKFFDLYTLMRSMSDTMSDMMWAKNLNNEYIFANEAFSKQILSAVDTSEPIGKTDLFFAQRERDLHPDDPNWHTFGEICANTDVITLQEMKQMQFDEYGNVKGKFIFLDVNKAPLYNEKHKLIGVVGSARDVTQRKIMEQTLKDAEQYTSSILATIPDLMFVLDADGTFLDFKSGSGVGLYMFKDEFLGKNVFDILPESIARQTKEAIDVVMKKETSSPFEYQLPYEDEIGYYECNLFPFGETKVIAMIRNITVSKKMNQVLESSRTELKAIYDNAPVMMCLVNEDRRILFANHAFTELTSTIEIDLKGGRVGAVVGCVNSLDDPRGCGYGKNCESCELRLAMEDTFNTGIGHRDIEYHSTPMFNGERREVFLLGSTAIITNNEEKNLLLCMHDITDRKRAEKELMEQKHFFEQMFMQSSVSTQILDREGWCEKINPKLSQLFGVDPKHIEGKVYNIFNDEAIIKGGIIPSLEKVFVKGQSTEWEVFFDIGLAADSQDIVVHDKKKAWLNNWAYPIFEQNGEISHVIIQHNDITDRKQAEEALQKSEMFLRTFIENTPFEIWARDVNSIGILENKKMIDHFGSQIGQTPISYSNIEPEITQLWESNNKRVLNGEMIDEVVKYKIDNHPYIYQQIIFPIYNNEIIIGIAGFNIDITERVQIEDELKESQSLYFSFIEQLPNAVFRKDREGRFLLVNSQFCKLKGLKKEDLIGNTPKEVAATEIASRGEQGRAFKYANTGEDIHELILQTGKFFEAEEEYSTSNGDKQYMHVVRMPVVDSSGIIIGSQGIMFDVTERKLIEDALNNSEEQLKLFAAHLQNIREEERTDLAREIHDDLGQILVAMKIDLGLMKQKVLKSINLAFLEDITTKFDNLFNLLDNTIKTTRRIMTGLRPEVLELLGFVEATRLYTIDFQERHNISCQFESTLTKLVITSQQSVALFRILQEALTNVVRHAMATEVKVLLSIHNNKLIMEIIDNGIGFDENYKGRSDSYGMIGMKERVFLLEGELTIKGETGKGTTVKIEMPYISDQLTVIS